MRKTTTASLAAIALSLFACGVPKDKYDAAVRDATSAKDQSNQCARDLQTARDDANAKQKRADDLEAELAKIRSELMGAQAKSEEEQRARLEELKKAEEAAQARAKLLQDFISRFKKMIDAGQLKIAVRRGRIVLRLKNDVLFDTGKTVLKPEGKTALVEIAQALKTVQGRKFQVSGHTDSNPIRTKEFPSNWELSTARAVEVVKLLASQGVNSDMLSAAGYGPYDPIATNASPAGQAKNRRIEIALQPNIEDLVSLPELKETQESD